jgi:hypothetical protein
MCSPRPVADIGLKCGFLRHVRAISSNAQPRRRLKFDPTKELTLRESLQKERRREERKEAERQVVCNLVNSRETGGLTRFMTSGPRCSVQRYIDISERIERAWTMAVTARLVSYSVASTFPVSLYSILNPVNFYSCSKDPPDQHWEAMQPYLSTLPR